jgi:hypothetical protein
MKFFSKKVVPAKTPQVIKNMLPASMKSADTGSSQSLLGSANADDEPTWFTTFSLFYFGFFGITLLLYPQIHTSDAGGLFANPIAYWTSISDETAFTFRIAGAGFLTLVTGPFFDEMFGGAGVTMMAFTRQMCMINLLIFVLFQYYTFYAPLASAIALIWKCQTAFGGLLLGWNIVEVVSSGLKEYYTLFLTAEFSFFALTLAIAPQTLYGPSSPLAYWNEWGDLALCTARSLGLGMIGLFIVGYYFFSSNPGYTKMCTLWNVAITGLMAIPAFYGGSSAVASMWMIQFVLQVPVLVVGLYLELSGQTGPWAFTFSCPVWGLNFESFNMFSLVFNVPFVIAFFYDPNMMFGPSTPTGMPMFKEDLTETSLWFGKAWATAILLIVLGPYLFGLPARGVTKQLTVVYLFFTGLFAYSLYAYSIFEVMMIGPMTGLNVILFGLGAYLALNSGDPLYMA